MRDSQRQRVYDAQLFISNGGVMTLAGCQEWVDEIVGSAWWSHRSSIRKVKVTHGAKNSGAWAHWEDDSIRTSPGARNKRTMLHELAHHLTGVGYAPHGPEFCANFVALTRQFLGREQGDALKVAFRENRVRVRGAAKPTVRRVHCIECDKRVSERGAWRLRHETYWFCTRRCGEKWIKGRLERVD